MEQILLETENSLEELLHLVSDVNFSSSKKMTDKKMIFEALNHNCECQLKHAKRVSRLAGKLAKHCSVEKSLKKKIKIAALLHDIGKLGIPDEILNSPKKLTNEQYQVIKQHSRIGYRLLSASNDFREVSIYALQHHERYDGTGYPSGLSGEDISLPARIITIVDSFDAMISNRPYRKAMTKQQAIDELVRCSGTQFDPYLVKLFVEKVVKIRKVKF